LTRKDRTGPARLVATPVHGRYLVQRPERGAPRGWFVGFHGYAQNAEVFLELLRSVPHTDDWLTVSVQALHPFYASRTNEVVANWMTRQDREHAIADNVAYVDAVLADLEREFGPPAALVFAGFSQGVAMAYRAGLLCRRACDALFVVAGDVPPELKSGERRKWPAVRILVGSRETYYTPEILNRDLEFLRSNGADVRATAFEGGHEWTAEVLAAAGETLQEFGRNARGVIAARRRRAGRGTN
jgi:predicted esterase